MSAAIAAADALAGAFGAFWLSKVVLLHGPATSSSSIRQLECSQRAVGLDVYPFDVYASLTSTRCCTLRTIPRIDGVSSCSTEWWSRLRPRLSIIFLWFRANPMVLFFQVIEILAIGTLYRVSRRRHAALYLGLISLHQLH